MSISEKAAFIKKLIPVDIPEGYPLKPVLKEISSEENIRDGVLAFRTFMYGFYDRLITDGGLYETPPKKGTNASHDGAVSLAVGYPFINNMVSVLVNIGYRGVLSENRDSILLENAQSLRLGVNTKQSLSVPKVMKYLRFLSSCGLRFDGIDVTAGKPDLEKIGSAAVTYSDDPAMLTGLKVMAIAYLDFSAPGDYYVFHRCDYKILLSEPPSVSMLFKEYMRFLPAEAREFLGNLHQQSLDAGMLCRFKMHYFGVIFSYSYKSNALWDFMPLLDGGYIFTKAKNMPQYADTIETFPPRMRERISRGYGCEPKMFGEPCQKGCHGYSFPLDDSITGISQYIKIWLDKELSCLKK